jgi:hypothetical protein
MTRIANILISISLTLLSAGYLHAQDHNDETRFNTNLGMTISAPLNPTARFVSVGWGTVYGAGYNFNRRNGVIGEVMWNRLNSTEAALLPIRSALNAFDIGGHGNLVALTANYRFELRGKVLGTYLIGGGGLYYRNASLTRSVVTGTNIVCNPVWFWWGYTCESGTVTSNQTLASSSSSAFGGNAGFGFTARVGEPDPPYRIYVETRYHYAPNKHISTQLIAITVGIRY